VKEKVRYLGMLLHRDRKTLRKEVDGQIRKNIKFLKLKLRYTDTRVMETLVNCYARSLLIYLGTSLVAAKIWTTEDIERKEKAIIK
jgi:hypothetical protein